MGFEKYWLCLIFVLDLNVDFWTYASDTSGIYQPGSSFVGLSLDVLEDPKRRCAARLVDFSDKRLKFL